MIGDGGGWWTTVMYVALEMGIVQGAVDKDGRLCLWECQSSPFDWYRAAE